jgi:hypothetical protein
VGRKGQKEHRISAAEREEVVRLRRHDGLPLVAIADRLCLKYSTVRWICAAAGVTVPGHVRGRNNRASYVRQSRERLAAYGVGSWDAVMDLFARKRGGEHIGKFESTRALTRWRCTEGHEFDAKPANIQQGQWCPTCVIEARRLSLPQLADLARVHGGKLVSTMALGTDQIHEWECRHGHVFTSRPDDVRGGHWCNVCAGNAPLRVADLHQLAANKGWRFLGQAALGAAKDHEWLCAHGHRFLKRPANVPYSGCPVCSAGRHVSQGQRWVYETVCSLLPSTEVRLTDTVMVKPLELDVYVPALNKAIEFDGTYWHRHEKVAARDRRKERACSHLGIELHRVREEDWSRDKPTVRRQIAAFLGVEDHGAVEEPAPPKVPTSK